MKRHAGFVTLLLLSALAAALVAGCKGRLETVTLRMGNRMYTNFSDTATVRLGEKFPIGDTQFLGQVDRFIPDFAINEKKQVISRSEEIKNPAVHVKVYEGDKVVEQSWAFPGEGAPHVAADNFMYFVIIGMKVAPEDSAHGGEQNAVVDSTGAAKPPTDH